MYCCINDTLGAKTLRSYKTCVTIATMLVECIKFIVFFTPIIPFYLILPPPLGQNLSLSLYLIIAFTYAMCGSIPFASNIPSPYS